MLLDDEGKTTGAGQIASNELNHFLRDFIHKYIAQGVRPQDICHLIATQANYNAAYQMQLIKCNELHI
jgi:hypothetical protein